MFGVFACVFSVGFRVRVRDTISAHNVLQKNNNLAHDKRIFQGFLSIFFSFLGLF